MGRLQARFRQKLLPPRRKIHIDQEFHPPVNTTSRSSLRHAAYRSACNVFAFQVGVIGEQRVNALPGR
jgi:hypothetical protein